jgi:hypothetical protein
MSDVGRGRRAVDVAWPEQEDTEQSVRVHYMSDLHLEFDRFENPLPMGEVLLSRWTSRAKVLDDANGSIRARTLGDATLLFFDEAC